MYRSWFPNHEYSLDDSWIPLSSVRHLIVAAVAPLLFAQVFSAQVPLHRAANYRAINNVLLQAHESKLLIYGIIVFPRKELSAKLVFFWSGS